MKQIGFTLVELMIVVAIVGILASVALPSYREYVVESNRSDGYAAILRRADDLERFYLNNNYTYTGANANAENSTEGLYSITVAVDGGGQAYTITATGLASQAEDTGCEMLVYTSTAAKTPAACW